MCGEYERLLEDYNKALALYATTFGVIRTSSGIPREQLVGYQATSSSQGSGDTVQDGPAKALQRARVRSVQRIF